MLLRDLGDMVVGVAEWQLLKRVWAKPWVQQLHVWMLKLVTCCNALVWSALLFVLRVLMRACLLGKISDRRTSNVECGRISRSTFSFIFAFFNSKKQKKKK